MTIGETFTARVESIAAGGAGIARAGGKAVFIELTAPGDTVRCRVKKDSKNFAEAELLEILESSPQRVIPECPLYGRCGGCSLQHINYESQIEAKTAILRETIKRIGGLVPPEIHAARSKPFGYRNRVQFHVSAAFNDTAVQQDPRHFSDTGKPPSPFGFTERKSRTVVALKDCPAADEGIRKALREGKITPPPKERFSVFSSGDTFLSEGGTEKGNVLILGKNLRMDVKVFFQSNVAMLELLIGDLVEAAKTADRSLPLADIYCGIGTFASFLGGEFPAIDLVEENSAALVLAEENLPSEKKTDLYSQNDSVWVKTMREKLSRRGKKSAWGFMVLDPPREGLSEPVRNFIAEYGSENLAYVSCDPATFARDCRTLSKGGYVLKKLNFYDFYPQTAHIESLALFSREKKSEA